MLLALQPIRMAPASSVVGVATEAFHKSQEDIISLNSIVRTERPEKETLQKGEHGLVFDWTPETRGFIATSAHFRV